MNLLNLLQQAQGGQGLGQLAAQLGLDQSQAESVAQELAPAVSAGVKRQAQSGGLESILGALQGEAQGQYLDNPAAAAAPEAQAQGAAFMEQIFGGQDVAQAVAERTAEKTGVGMDQIGALLPALGAMLQGGMQRAAPDQAIQQVQQSGGLEALMSQLGGAGGGGGGLGGMLGALTGGGSGGGGGGLGGMLGALTGGGGQAAGGGAGLEGLLGMLDADGDGSVLDDVMQKLGK